MPKVIVVPETEEYALDVSHTDIVWVTKALGVPKLEEHDARYLAPLWLKDPAGVTRIYHILRAEDVGTSTEISLGNSFVLLNAWNSPGQRRRFEYHDLSVFGLTEICPGLLFRAP
jgi:hypothetical protein